MFERRFFLKKQILFIILSLFLIMASACSNQKESSSKNSKKINVYTTVYPLEYFTKEIGGQYVNVSTIYPPGSDEHTYEPSQKDMMELADSDLFIYIGLGLEGFSNKAKDILNSQHVEMVAAGETLTLPDTTFNNGDEQGDVNPHVWLDPIYMKEMSHTITKELSKKMPEHKQLFEQNDKNVAKRLDALNQQFMDMSKQAKKKEMVVTHAAYSYWQQRYEIKQNAIAGISTTDEPSQKKLKKIIDTIKSDHLSYILFEQNVQSKLAEVVKEETGTKVLYLNNLAVLRDSDIKNKEDYFSLMQKNINTLKIALK